VALVNKEALAEQITKLKVKAKAAAEKAGDKKSEPAAREAKKLVKRAQRKLRAAKSYKTIAKKSKKAAGAPASA